MMPRKLSSEDLRPLQIRPDAVIDATPYRALTNIGENDRADADAYKMIRSILTILNVSGYELIGRLHLRDRTTGKEYN